MDTPRKVNVIYPDIRECGECKKAIPVSGFRFFKGGNMEVCPECYYKAHPGIPYENRLKG